jgi:histidine triad (HIT) family protein
MNTTCLFCKIVTKELPSSKVYEDENCFAFLDLHPINIGHTLLVPKAHSANLYDDTLAVLAPVIKKVAIAVKNTLNADGINIEMNNDPVAGQIIFHSHIHIIPRFSGDGFKHWHGARDYHEGEMEEIAQKISSVI